MSTNRGIFENLPSHPGNRIDSPFEVVREPASISSPFSAAVRQESPFTVADTTITPRPVEAGRPPYNPEKQKVESPFQIADTGKSFGFEAPAADAPISAAVQQAVASPFSVEPRRGASPSTDPAIVVSAKSQESPPPVAMLPQAFAQSAVPVPTEMNSVPQVGLVANQWNSDSFAIRQLELRAIFGVDRELNSSEILQRARTLPGMRTVARVSQQDMATVDAMKLLLTNLGLGSGGLKIYSDSVPLEFIREGAVMLAVQADAGFAPGVREMLMLVARELDRLS